MTAVARIATARHRKVGPRAVVKLQNAGIGIRFGKRQVDVNGNSRRGRSVGQRGRHKRQRGRRRNIHGDKERPIGRQAAGRIVHVNRVIVQSVSHTGEVVRTIPRQTSIGQRHGVVEGLVHGKQALTHQEFIERRVDEHGIDRREAVVRQRRRHDLRQAWRRSVNGKRPIGRRKTAIAGIVARLHIPNIISLRNASNGNNERSVVGQIRRI